MKEIPDEKTAITRAKNGDEAGYSWLLTHYNSAIHDYCRRIIRGEDARDLAQEAFVKAFLSIETFDEKKRFAPWLFRIAHNLIIDYLRKKRVPTYSMTVAGETETYDIDFGDVSVAPDELLHRKEIRTAFDTALESLDAEFKEVLILRHREGFSYNEIARVLELPLGTVKARIHRGREKLKQKLIPFV